MADSLGPTQMAWIQDAALRLATADGILPNSRVTTYKEAWVLAVNAAVAFRVIRVEQKLHALQQGPT